MEHSEVVPLFFLKVSLLAVIICHCQTAHSSSVIS